MRRRQRPSLISRYWSRGEVAVAMTVAFAAGVAFGWRFL